MTNMLTVGKAVIEFLGDPVPFAGRPMALAENAPEEQLGSVHKFRVTTTDQLNYVFGLVQWPSANPEVIFLEGLNGDSKYEPLTHAGRMGVLTSFGNVWLMELRAMKYNPTAKKTNLAGANLSDLDSFVNGNAFEILTTAGAIDVGTREKLVGDTKRNRNYLALTCQPGNFRVAAVAFTITRVLAIMKDYGHSQ